MSKYMDEVNDIAAGLEIFLQDRNKVNDPLGRVAFFFQREIKTSFAKIDEFTKRLAVNPANAFEWGDEYIDAAARLEVYAGLAYTVVRVNKGETTHTDALKHLREFGMREMTRFACNPSRSTGQCSNLVERYKGAAYARMFDGFNGLLTEKV